MRKFLIATILLALSAGAAACGGDDGGGSTSVAAPKLSADEQKAADALLTSFEEDGDFPGSPQERKCVVAKTVKSLGAARTLELSGSGGSNLARADAEKVVEAMTSCMDLGALIAKEITAGGDISDKSASCLAKSFDKALLTNMMLAGLTGEGSEDVEADGMKKVLAAMSTCLSADELKVAGLG